jgi:hypothetical protein
LVIKGGNVVDDTSVFCGRRDVVVVRDCCGGLSVSDHLPQPETLPDGLRDYRAAMLRGEARFRLSASIVTGLRVYRNAVRQVAGSSFMPLSRFGWIGDARDELAISGAVCTVAA